VAHGASSSDPQCPTLARLSCCSAWRLADSAFTGEGQRLSSLEAIGCARLRQAIYTGGLQRPAKAPRLRNNELAATPKNRREIKLPRRNMPTLRNPKHERARPTRGQWNNSSTLLSVAQTPARIPFLGPRMRPWIAVVRGHPSPTWAGAGCLFLKELILLGGVRRPGQRH
jgi:hypothetical protein